jgi:hypothetical protein
MGRIVTPESYINKFNSSQQVSSSWQRDFFKLTHNNNGFTVLFRIPLNIQKLKSKHDLWQNWYTNDLKK